MQKALLQELFPRRVERNPCIRFTYFDSNWHKQKLAKLITHNTTRNKELKIKTVESISNRRGLIKQTDQFNQYSVASKNLSNYYILQPGYFAYNPSRINVGSIAYKRNDQTSLVSPLYVSFYTAAEINDDYLLEWFKTDDFKLQRQRLSEGSVRELLSFNQLAEMKLKFASYSEQAKIARLLELVNQKIKLNEQKIAKLITLNKSLLHKMLL
ncbi:hypothetical protein M3M38_05440 [Fructilactobacillus cliffordii]|uniref:restriction endonuclease subunit S n=1 Tax=Fructilactobacillus cliffordii TaxID=2940299 RepID=UPI0020927ED2|nr:hypothetical protein [Fructilactobacillus cliffordii]USS86141.1 hypothetical protein M3M38_05440 [Fructilactobacillus cliffordii]